MSKHGYGDKKLGSVGKVHRGPESEQFFRLAKTAKQAILVLSSMQPDAARRKKGRSKPGRLFRHSLGCLIMVAFLCMPFCGYGAQADTSVPTDLEQASTLGPLDPNTGPGTPAPLRAARPVENSPTADPNLSSGWEGIANLDHLKDKETDEQSAGHGSTALALFFRSMGALLVVIALMITALSLSKRVLPKLGKHAGKEIKVIETTLLGPRKYLHVVKVANQRLLLGSTNDRINMLAHLVDDLSALDIEKATEKEEI